jgi:hypothetical protein
VTLTRQEELADEPPASVGVPADQTDHLLAALRQYRAARIALLSAIGTGGSNRDPLAEFAERIAHAQLGGTLATSRVQKGWDFLDPEGRTVQVRYVANPAGTWVNEPVIDFRGGCERFALVAYEALDARALLVFSSNTMAAVNARLAKRHRDLDVCLGLTQRNYAEIVTSADEFRALGVEVFLW